MQTNVLYVTVRLQKAEPIPFSAVAQQSNTFLQLLQDQANSSQQVFLLVDEYFHWVSTDLSPTSASHKCFRIYKGPVISFRLGGGAESLDS